MIVYHVVTQRPMDIGQIITFDKKTQWSLSKSSRKIDIINDIYTKLKNYDNATFEHHTSVALRELALEEIRKQHYPNEGISEMLVDGKITDQIL